MVLFLVSEQLLLLVQNAGVFALQYFMYIKFDIVVCACVYVDFM